jgi:acyl-coenzyme A thioesterase PaaI-like protein
MTTTDRAAAFFRTDGDTFVPTPNARGPWGQTVSGNYVGGLLGHIVDRDQSADADLQPTRFTVDLLRPVPMAPLTGQSRVIRRGRRLTLVDAELRHDDALVARASALFLRRGVQPEDDAWTTPVSMPPVPPEPADTDGRALLLWVFGGGSGDGDPVPSSDLSGWQHDGPKSVWLRDIAPLVDGVALTPFVRIAIAGDYASSLTNFGSTGLPFINADYSVSLTRLPDGPHIGLSALTHHSDDGIATGTAALFDRQGQIGTATASALANPGFAPPPR